MKFSLTGSGRMNPAKLQELGVPVLDAYTLLVPEQDWRKNPEGLNAVEESIAVAMPELDGVIHGVPVAGRVREADGAVHFTPLPERIERMAAKAAKWARLHRLPNKDKKIALIFHNYPAKTPISAAPPAWTRWRAPSASCGA